MWLVPCPPGLKTGGISRCETHGGCFKVWVVGRDWAAMPLSSGVRDPEINQPLWEPGQELCPPDGRLVGAHKGTQQRFVQ